MSKNWIPTNRGKIRVLVLDKVWYISLHLFIKYNTSESGFECTNMKIERIDFV